MPENNHEVIIDGYVYPDTVTITLANDDFVGSRDYVDKDLYESVNSANDYWQAENTKLRELVQYICDENYGDDWFVEEAAALGIEAHY